MVLWQVAPCWFDQVLAADSGSHSSDPIKYWALPLHLGYSAAAMMFPVGQALHTIFCEYIVLVLGNDSMQKKNYFCSAQATFVKC